MKGTFPLLVFFKTAARIWRRPTEREMDGSLKRKRPSSQAPLAPERKHKASDKKPGWQKRLDLCCDEWLFGEGPAPVDAPPARLTCTPPSEDEEVKKILGKEEAGSSGEKKE